MYLTVDKPSRSTRFHDPFDPVSQGGLVLALPEFKPEQILFHREAQSEPRIERGSQPRPRTACFACSGPPQRMQKVNGPFYPEKRDGSFTAKMEVHTLRYGNQEWMAECVPTLESWCSRHGHPLTVWQREQIPASYPNEKFICLDILREFLASENDWCCWIDADVYCHPLAPEFPVTKPGFHVMIDQPSGATINWPEWVLKNYGRDHDGEWKYRNAGVWACDKASAMMILCEAESAPLAAGWMEQHQFNVWLSEARAKGLPIHDLTHEWNSFPGNGAAWFHHFAGKKKEKKLYEARAKGLLPDAIKRPGKLPPIPDFGAGAVVWPWASGKADWDELWFSYQSVRKHWSEKDWPLVLLADRKPDWWQGEFINASRYEDALWIGTQCAEKVLWMNDDIFMLADQSPADFALARHLGEMGHKLGQTLTAGNSWRRGLGQVLMRLHHNGLPTKNFSTHTPYLYQRDKAAAVHAAFGQFYKVPFETAYFNFHRQSFTHCVEKAKSPQDLRGKLWVNPSFRQVTTAFLEELSGRFGNPP